MSIEFALNLKSGVNSTSIAMMLLLGLSLTACNKATSLEEIGRWEIEAATVAKFQTPTPEFSGRLLLYRLDISQDSVMVRIDLDVNGYGKSTHASTFPAHISAGKIVIKDAGKEVILLTSILHNGQLEINSHLQALPNMVFETKSTEHELARNNAIRKILNGIQANINPPLRFDRKVKPVEGKKGEEELEHDLSSP